MDCSESGGGGSGAAGGVVDVLVHDWENVSGHFPFCCTNDPERGVQASRRGAFISHSYPALNAPGYY
jgi:hypothetical protein